jgi:hypothetical protein
VLVQKGGAAWYSGFGVRKAAWMDAPIYDTTVGKLFPLHFSDDPRVADKSAMLEEHFQILEMQDELFNVALNLIRAKVKRDLSLGELTEEVIRTNADKIDAIVDWNAYLDDVEGLINLKIDTEEDGVDGLTKLQSIKKESLSTLLLFPQRANNQFVQLLANVLIVLKQSNVLNTLTSPSLITIAVDQYQSNVYGNAYLSTARALRDGFYLGQGEKDFLTEQIEGKQYWSNLITQLVAIKKGGYAVPTFLEEEATGWIDTTAKLFAVYAGTGLEPTTLFNELFKDVTTNIMLGSSTRDREFSPASEYDKIPIRNTTYGDIIKKIKDETMQFVLHLAYTIRKNEASVLAEITAKPAGI